MDHVTRHRFFGRPRLGETAVPGSPSTVRSVRRLWGAILVISFSTASCSTVGPGERSVSAGARAGGESGAAGDSLADAKGFTESGLISHSQPSVAFPGERVTLAFGPSSCPSEGETCAYTGLLHWRADTTKGDVPLVEQLGSGLLAATLEVPDGATAVEYWVELSTGGTTSRWPPAGHRAFELTVGNEGPSRVDIALPDLTAALAGSASAAPVVVGPWGPGESSFGMDFAGETPVGPASFDVAEDGSVVVVDQANRRLVLVDANGGRRVVPVEISAGISDVRFTAVGDVVVFEEAPAAVVKLFTTDGVLLDSARLGNAIAGGLGRDAAGVWALEGPQQEWRLVVRAGDRAVLAPEEQAVLLGNWAGSSDGGRDLRVSVRPDETRLAVIDSAGAAARVVSLRGGGLNQGALHVAHLDEAGGGLVVQAMYGDTATGHVSVFAVLQLEDGKIASVTVLPESAAAETSPRGRFRFVDGRLYQSRLDDGSYTIVEVGL